MVQIQMSDLTKRFGDVVAVDRVSLAVLKGSFFTILGPSGCGKTTLLRILAGFELPDEGSLAFDGVDVTSLPPHKRDTGMVFQNYALWNHMSVFDNVAYGLKLRKVPKEELKQRISEVLRLVNLSGLEKRTPLQLSGGQQQRVALARALVIKPKVLLLDEPLSNLDAKLRLEVRAEIKKLQSQLGVTTVYVTHDQEEAMSISDRIAVMNQGALQQVGGPRDIYTHPETPFVADFIGQSTFFEGAVKSVDGFVSVETKAGLVVRGVLSAEGVQLKEGDSVVVSIRPEAFHTSRIGDEANSISVKVDHTAYLGSTQKVYASFGDNRVVAEVGPEVKVEWGSQLELYARPEDTTIIKI